MKPIRIVIIEDENRIRKSLINLLKLHYPNAHVIGEAEDVDSGILAIKKHNPDVVLLDINMPGGTGFDLLKKLQPLTFKVIFITAFDQFAVQAFKFSAIDYLLKPVIPRELVEALLRTEQQLSAENADAKLDVFLSNVSGLTRENKKLILNCHDKMHIVSINEIVKCDADGNYTSFCLINQKTIVVSRPLKEFEEMLVPFGFFRCHHSHLINLSLIDRLEKKDGGLLVMKDGTQVQVSSRKQAELVAALNKN